jgi:hypothetical protein
MMMEITLMGRTMNRGGAAIKGEVVRDSLIVRILAKRGSWDTMNFTNLGRSWIRY